MPSSASNARTSCATGTACVEVRRRAAGPGRCAAGRGGRRRRARTGHGWNRQGAEVGRPDDHRQLARRDLVGGTAAGEGDVRGLAPTRAHPPEPLLVERVAPVVLPGGDLRALEDAARPALQHGRPVPQRPQDAVADRQEVADHVQLGQPTLRESTACRGWRRGPAAPPPGSPPPPSPRPEGTTHKRAVRPPSGHWRGAGGAVLRGSDDALGQVSSSTPTTTSGSPTKRKMPTPVSTRPPPASPAPGRRRRWRAGRACRSDSSSSHPSHRGAHPPQPTRCPADRCSHRQRPPPRSLPRPRPAPRPPRTTGALPADLARQSLSTPRRLSGTHCFASPDRGAAPKPTAETGHGYRRRRPGRGAAWRNWQPSGSSGTARAPRTSRRRTPRRRARS